ncbi:hypothetical protein ACS0TY_020481 [Phlomoides rotata]
MGKWNRRYIPRKKYRHYDYDDDPPLSSDNRVPSWEVDYCNSVGVPWKKVFASKKYIYGYPSVLNWDGSAAEEALQNAKERFWAVINDLPCDNPLPDPDLYIDEIDWNPQMDPELMAELDLPIFDPDKAQKDENLETIDEWVECAQTQYDKNKFTSDNPWESNNTQGAGSLKDANDNPWERNNTQGAGSLKDASDNPWKRNNTQGAGSLEDISDNPWQRDNMQGAGSSKDLHSWGRWDDTVNLKNANPWEQISSQPVESLKDTAWRSGNESWGRSQGFDKTKSSPFFDNGCSNSRNINGQTMAEQQGWGQGRGRGRGHKGNNSWGWNQWNTNAEGQMNLGNCGYSCENNYSTGFKERGWRDKTNESWGGKKAEFQGSEPKYWDSQTFDRGGRSFSVGGRKRESSIQNTSKYKSSKYHRDTYRDGHQF